MRIFLFNPSNDMALASGVDEYVPTKAIQKMEAGYEMIPSLIAEDGDIVCDVASVGSLKLGVKNWSDVTICPWGWSKPLKNKLKRSGVPEELLPSDGYLDNLRRLSSREFCVKYSREFGYDGMKMCFSASDIPDFRPIILKALWSSSGRGNKVLGQQSRAFSPKQDQCCVGNSLRMKFPCVADFFYNKVQDFAMEFMVKSDRVEYLGLSVFKASKEGRYEYNFVASQPELTKMIDDDETELIAIKERHLKLLTKHLVGQYEGPVGIDMMVVEDSRMKIHPCVEINLRMNMGILALEIYKKYGAQISTISLESLKALVVSQRNIFANH